MEQPDRPAFDRYRREGFEQVRGWCNAKLLTFLELVDALQHQAGVSGSVGEIGVQDGKLFIALHNLLREGERSLAIDVFDDYHLNVDRSGDAKLDLFQENVRRFAEHPQRCTAMKIDSMDLGPIETNQILTQFGKFRMFSIDGSHTLDHTINDFLFVERIVANGGIVLVDDYYNPYWPEVHQAIGYIYTQRRSKLAPMFYQCGKLFFTTAAYADTYKRAVCDYFRERDPNEPIKLCNFYGHSIVLLDNYK